MFGRDKKKDEKIETLERKLAQIRLILFDDAQYLERTQAKFDALKFNDKNEYIRSAIREETEIKQTKQQNKSKNRSMTLEEWKSKDCNNGCRICKECLDQLDEIHKDKHNNQNLNGIISNKSNR